MGKAKILESNENYYELERNGSEIKLPELPEKTPPTKSFITKLPTTHKDYNLKELYLVDRDLYKSLLKVTQGVLNVQFVDTADIKIYSTTTEDLQKDTIASVCRIFFADDKINNSIVGYAVLYVREKQIEINAELQSCYIARGSSVIFEEFRGKTQAAGFSIQYLEEFISNHNDKPTFLFSTNLLTCCPVNSETEVDYDGMVRNNKIWKAIEASRRSSIDYSILGRLEDYQELHNFKETQEAYKDEVKIAGDFIDNESLVVPE